MKKLLLEIIAWIAFIGITAGITLYGLIMWAEEIKALY